MNNRLTKLGFAALALAALVGSSSGINAYPPFLRQAKQLGLATAEQDCTFCHLQKEGGEGWNERGKFLIAEKEKRQSERIEVAWLKEYKPADGDTAKSENKEGEKPKEGEKDPKKPKDPVSR